MARPKKSIPPIKNREIKIRFTEELYDVLASDALAARLPRTEYIRQLILNHHPMIKQEIVFDNSEVLELSHYSTRCFHQECQELNARYNQNQARADIKAHHYILSFDPRDRDENGLTPEQAQQLTIAFAKKNFPGHQTIVCTHPGGHNSAGNIHTHIFINSVRALDIKRQDFMERPTDSLVGKNHHVAKDLLKYLKQEIMKLYQ